MWFRLFVDTERSNAFESNPRYGRVVILWASIQIRLDKRGFDGRSWVQTPRNIYLSKHVRYQVRGHPFST